MGTQDKGKTNGWCYTHAHTCFKFDPAVMVVDGDDDGGNSDPHIPIFMYVREQKASVLETFLVFNIVK